MLAYVSACIGAGCIITGGGGNDYNSWLLLIATGTGGAVGAALAGG